MAINNVVITQGSNAQVFASGTVPAGKTYGVSNMLICNTAAEDQTGANDATCRVFVVPSGQSSNANANMIINDALLPGAETFILDTEKLMLTAGDTVVVENTAVNNVTLIATVSYLEV